MKLIIAGGRNCPEFTEEQIADLDAIEGVTEVVSGKARGADTHGKNWAKSRELPVKEFPALWNKHGPSAGPRRNRQMAEYADAVVLFPGGNGTANIHKHAKELGLKIYDWRENK